MSRKDLEAKKRHHYVWAKYLPSQSITQADINQVKQKVYVRAQGIQQE